MFEFLKRFLADKPVPLAADPFMQQVASEKARTDAAASVALQQHTRELDERFADDVRLKERLSQFARDNDLDKALIALWEEIEHYPECSRRGGLGKWNKLHLSGINGTKEKDTETIEFMQGAQRFKVKQRTWRGEEGKYADFSFLEDGDEVFAITCSVEWNEYVTSYLCFNVSSFKKQGNWAKVLLQYYWQIRIEKSKSSAELKYAGADKIASRFKE